MLLAEELERLTQALRAKAPEHALRVIAAGIEELRASGLESRALRAGDRLPDFALPDAAGRLRHLGEYLEQGPLVLAFFRGAWCPYCTIQLQALAAVDAQVRALGANLVAISPQTVACTAQAAAQLALPFPLLCDTANDTARACGLVFRLPEAMRASYRDDFAIDLSCYNGDRRDELPMPATYIADREGVIRHAFIDVDYARRMEPADILAALRGITGAARG